MRSICCIFCVKFYWIWKVSILWVFFSLVLKVSKTCMHSKIYMSDTLWEINISTYDHFQTQIIYHSPQQLQRIQLLNITPHQTCLRIQVCVFSFKRKRVEVLNECLLYILCEILIEFRKFLFYFLLIIDRSHSPFSKFMMYTNYHTNCMYREQKAQETQTMCSISNSDYSRSCLSSHIS